MKLINKVIVSTLAVSTIGAGVMFMNYNSSNILTDYNNIQNGVSKRADLKAQMIQPGNKEGSDDPLVTSNQFDPSKGYQQNSPVPDSLDPNEVIAWVNAQNISPQRKALLNKGLAVFKKARYNCVTPAHMNQNVPDITGLEIECSGFIGYCMKQGAGIDKDSDNLGNVAGIAKSPKWEHVKSNFLPGDCGFYLKAYQNGASGHIGYYIGENSKGEQIFLHAGGSSKERTPTPFLSTHPSFHKDEMLRYIPLAEFDKQVATSTPAPGVTTIKSGTVQEIQWNQSWKYANLSVVHDPSVKMTVPQNPNGKVVCIDPGHGSIAASKVSTRAYPNGEPILTSGTNKAGSTTRTGASTGGQFVVGNHMTEAEATLKLGKIVKQKLLDKGYTVIMVREASDCNNDNIARMVYANNNAQMVVSLHFNDKSAQQNRRMMVLTPVAGSKDRENLVNNYQTIKATEAKFKEGFAKGGWGIKADNESDLAFFAYSSIPAVMCEMADFDDVLSDADFDTMANSVVAGIENVLK